MVAERLLGCFRQAAHEPGGLLTIADLVRGSAAGTASKLGSGPVVFSGCGMAWQDLVVARAIVEDAQTG